MVDRNKILSDLSKFAVDAMSTFSGVKEEIETIVSLRVNKIIKKMNLVKKDEFDALKKMVQKVMIENEKLKKTSSMISMGFNNIFSFSIHYIVMTHIISTIS